MSKQPINSHDWEQRKLGEMANFSKGRGYSKGDLEVEGSPIILYGRLYTKYETAIENVDTFVSETEGSVISHGGEVIVPASGETSEDIARASSVVNNGIIIGGDLNIIKPIDILDSVFLALLITYGKTHRELASKAQGKSIVHIHNSEIKGLNIIFPLVLEQSYISKFFRNIDFCITLHHRKLKSLKLLKKALLQKLFPKKDAKVPEIRFKGFTNDWVQRKFTSLYIITQLLRSTNRKQFS